jgi:dermatan 4-sulfotransferase 1
MLERIKYSFVDFRKRKKNKKETPQYWEFKEDNIGYIQIPKVASRSIRKAFSDAFNVKENKEDFDKFENLYSKHLHQEDIRKSVDKGVFVFSFVRHPLSRLYSAWMNKVNTNVVNRRCIFSCHGINYGMPFNKFVEHVCKIEDKYLDRHLKPQSWFLTDSHGLIPQYIGKLENFETDYEYIRSRFKKLMKPPHSNSSVYEIDWKNIYNDKTMIMVKERYHVDFELFEYDIFK